MYFKWIFATFLFLKMLGKSIKFVHLLNLLNCDSVNKVTKALKS